MPFVSGRLDVHRQHLFTRIRHRLDGAKRRRNSMNCRNKSTRSTNAVLAVKSIHPMLDYNFLPVLESSTNIALNCASTPIRHSARRAHGILWGRLAGEGSHRAARREHEWSLSHRRLSAQEPVMVNRAPIFRCWRIKLAVDGHIALQRRNVEGLSRISDSPRNAHVFNRS
jgi:hypothetical protein